MEKNTPGFPFVGATAMMVMGVGVIRVHRGIAKRRRELVEV